MQIRLELEVWIMNRDKIKVAIIGTGNIGTDLCERLLKDSKFVVVAFVGRRLDSSGLARMQTRVPNVLDTGTEALEKLWDQIRKYRL